METTTDGTGSFDKAFSEVRMTVSILQIIHAGKFLNPLNLILLRKKAFNGGAKREALRY
jgi:hypothetical protein